MTTQPKPQPHKKLIVFPQDKGGIGKSFVATLLYDYLAEHGVKLKTFDLDHCLSTGRSSNIAKSHTGEYSYPATGGIICQLVHRFAAIDRVIEFDRLVSI
jgi:cellulose biosynthesis protein BcsQ